MIKMEHFFEQIDGYSSMYDQGELLNVILNKVSSHNNLKIIEIGVYKGRCTALWNVELINKNISYEYYAVDHFLGSVEHNKDVDYWEITNNNLSLILDKIKLIKNDSESESKNHPNDFFDIIYIDASHDYESVKKDINCWYSKLKDGGIICGDDYIDGWPGVIQAVDEFFKDKEINLIGHQQWWVKK